MSTKLLKLYRIPNKTTTNLFLYRSTLSDFHQSSSIVPEKEKHVKLILPRVCSKFLCLYAFFLPQFAGFSSPLSEAVMILTEKTKPISLEHTDPISPVIAASPQQIPAPATADDVVGAAVPQPCLLVPRARSPASTRFSTPSSRSRSTPTRSSSRRAPTPSTPLATATAGRSTASPSSRTTS